MPATPMDHLCPAMVYRTRSLCTGHVDDIGMDDDLLAHDPWGYQSRYWSAKPTKEEMEAEPWQ